MGIPYDTFTEAFLTKVTEYDFADMDQVIRDGLMDSYMKRAIAEFKWVCSYDLTNTADDILREFQVTIPRSDLYEIADIISEGMLVQWMKPFVYRQDNLENILSTRDFTTYSPAELLSRISATYADVRKTFTNMVREYSYRHGDLSDLHL